MSIKEDVTNLIAGPIEEEGFDLVELKLAQYKNSRRIQVFVDSDNGVLLDDCARISRKLEDILEISGLFKSNYTLEVSSPGLDRPLHTAKDFARRIGETVEIFFNDSARAGTKGELVAVDEEQIELMTGDESVRLDLPDIKMGKIIF